MTRTRGGPRKGPWRAPGWVVPIVAGVTGYVVSNWMGAFLGVALGVMIWRSR